LGVSVKVWNRTVQEGVKNKIEAQTDLLENLKIKNNVSCLFGKQVVIHEDFFA
jgi:hypothetical protein